MELFEKQSRYKYTGGLVITRTESNQQSRSDIPTAEPETLNKFGLPLLREQMGIRSAYDRPLADGTRNRRKGDEEKQSSKKQSFMRSQARNVLDSQVDTSYKPQTQASADAYDKLMKFISIKFGAQTRSHMTSIADEILAICKNERVMAGPAKLSILNETFGGFSVFTNDDFNEVMKIGRRITDFGRSQNEIDIDKAAERTANQGVSVIWEEKEAPVEIPMLNDDEDSGDDQILPEFEDPNRKKREEERKKQANQELRSNMIIDDDNDIEIEDKEDIEMLTKHRTEVDPKTVDAFWLQRQLNKKYPLRDDNYTLSENVLHALETCNTRALEKKIIDLLGYEQFEFIKVLLRNKDIIVWCTKLKRAENDEIRKSIEKRMENDMKLCSILDAIREVYGTTEDKINKFRREAYREAKQIKQLTRDQQREQEKEQHPLQQTAIIKTDDKNRTQDKQDYSAVARWYQKHDKMQLDLDSLAFRMEGHHVSNSKWKLRSGSLHLQHKGYAETIVPPIAAHPEFRKRIPISDLPDFVQPAFIKLKDHRPINDEQERNFDEFNRSIVNDIKHDDTDAPSITHLNAIQSRCFDIAFNTSENMLLAAPTGAGKTNVAMLAILREIGIHLTRENNTFHVRKDEFKVVYIAPMKSLVREIVLKFSQRLAYYNLTVAELSGDQQLSKEQIANTQIIVTTPEKWDIITRKGMDRSYAQLVRLIIIDEIHLLHDSRGPVLECIVARTVRNIESTQEMIRLIGLSATLPNFVDIAMFLRVKPEKGLFVFNSEYRPIPLTQTFAGITLKKPFLQYSKMNDLCYEYAMKQCRNKHQVIIFVHSRKETFNTAKFLLKRAMEMNEMQVVLHDRIYAEILRTEAESGDIDSHQLKELLPHGFAIHNAGMTRSDRSLVEDLFRNEVIKVLVSTATLAWGVNMPAHAVIIKGTQIYNPEKGRWAELSMLDILQMFGRAGRPGSNDLEGEAYLITTHRELTYYMPLLNDQLPIESQLIHKLPDALNAEIVLGTIANLKEAVQWLRYTYLYIRMLRKPEIYKIPEGSIVDDPQLEQRRIDLCHSAAYILDECGLIKYDQRSGHFHCTDVGRVAAHYYISYETIKQYNEFLKPTMSDIEIFRVFSMSGEFKYLNVRIGEKEELAKLLDKVPIPVKESIDDGSAKVNVLLQSYISRLKLDGYELVADMCYVTQSAARLMRALFEITLKRKWAAVALRCLTLCKMIHHRMWSIESPLRQFGIRSTDNKLTFAVISRIEKSHVSWDRYFHLSSAEISELIRMPDSMGREVKNLVVCVPRVNLMGRVQPITRTLIRLELQIEADFQWDDRYHGLHSQEFWIIVEDVDGEYILHAEYFVLHKKFMDKTHSVVIHLSIFDPLPPQYFVRIISDKWIGSETVLPMSFRNLILPSKYFPPSELLDLQPLSITSIDLDFKEHEHFPFSNIHEFFDDESFTDLNAIQTQIFPALFSSNANLLLCGPSYCGKTLCAEIAILKMLNEYPNGTCVYIHSIQDICDIMHAKWNTKFNPGQVQMFTGDTSHDLRALKTAQIIISQPKFWDNISRKWRKRESVQNVNLFIVDDLHLIGFQKYNGSTLEMIIARQKIMIDDLQIECRIIGLSLSVANSKDLGDWLNAPYASPTAQFNFSQKCRPIHYTLHLHESVINNFESRQLSFIKPCYSYINTFRPLFNERVDGDGIYRILIWTPSSKHCRRLASDLVALVANEDNPHKFLSNFTVDEFYELLKKMMNEELWMNMKKKHSGLLKILEYGIGFIHEYTSNTLIKIICHLYKSGVIQILIIDQCLMWKMQKYGIKDGMLNNRRKQRKVLFGGYGINMVIVHGTQYYNGQLHTYTDYILPDILQMMSYANKRPARCVLFCHSNKKSYLMKFLGNDDNCSFPIESHFDLDLCNILNTEINSGTIENANDAMDILTWTFYYRRTKKNPNYYNLPDVGDQYLSAHFSDMIEQSFDHLLNANCIDVDENMAVQSLNNGMIADYFYLSYTTVEFFDNALSKHKKSGTAAVKKLKTILNVLSFAQEFESIAGIHIKKNEEKTLEKMSRHLILPVMSNNFTEIATKVNIILQLYFMRNTKYFEKDIARDCKKILKLSHKLLYAMIDILASKYWLKPVLICLELCQMISQGLWVDDYLLLQLPYFTKEDCKYLSDKYGINDVFQFLQMEDEQRMNALQNLKKFKFKEIEQIAKVCNSYPMLEIRCEFNDCSYLENRPVFKMNEEICVHVWIEREDDDDEDEDESMESIERNRNRKSKVPIESLVVHSAQFPHLKIERWYLIVGDNVSPNAKNTKLLFIKSIQMKRMAQKFKVKLNAPQTKGDYEYKLYFMSDSYLGCDIMQNLSFSVV